ncbi:DUF4625 domain-containing protein [uncultured Dysgonomonas sp.]|uniref:DUF4625 domain-containing protein n=1 Tax=uncultured Dysgonomonas sp. TaxID=206096 RepID=A0A212K5P8_9BACT|nr:DUF4625 domain-containing protein [uncultured Dysgonomonas sp.]SBW07044.1 conserved exported hypothetical protein [uncultured Dysgonomonas sp.]
MKKKIILYSLICLFSVACSNDDEDGGKDMEKPSIDMTGDSAFPQNCIVLYRGESFPFRAVFADNRELGNYNIEIHNNFDHHSHSTDDVECDLEPKKTPVKAFVYNQDFSIPSGKTRFEADNEISVPGDIDTGDYHFMVRLTDKAGWQQLRAISLKIKDRN